MAESDDKTTRLRIISHLNTDHLESASHLLQRFIRISRQEAHGAIFYDISLSSLKIETARSKIHTIAIDPPMESWSESRERLKDMTKAARQALGVAEKRIVPYKFPSSLLHVSVFSICLMTFMIFGLTLRGGFFVPGRYVYDKVLPYFPGGPVTFLKVVKILALPTLIIHAGETWYLDQTRLKKNGIKRGTKLWWPWAVSCFIEGFGSFQRFDAQLKKIMLNNKDTTL